MSGAAMRRLLALCLVLVLVGAQSLLRLHAIEHASGHQNVAALAQHSAASATRGTGCEHTCNIANSELAEDHRHTLFHDPDNRECDHARDRWGHDEGSLQCQWLDAQLTEQADFPHVGQMAQPVPSAQHHEAARSNPALPTPGQPYEARGPPHT